MLRPRIEQGVTTRHRTTVESGHQARNRQRQHGAPAGQYRAEPATVFNDQIDRGAKRRIIGADRHNIMRIMRHRRRDRTRFQSEPADKAHCRGCVRRITVHHDNFENITLRIGDNLARHDPGNFA